MSDTEEDYGNEMTVIGRLIEGCEEFVVNSLVESRKATKQDINTCVKEAVENAVKDAVMLTEEKLMHKVQKLEDIIRKKDAALVQLKEDMVRLKADVSKRFNTDKVNLLEQTLETHETEIERQRSMIEEFQSCKCEQVFDAVVSAGRLVFSEKPVTLLDQSSNIDQENMTAVESSFADVNESLILPNNDDSGQRRLVQSRLIIEKASTPRVVVQKLPETQEVFTNIDAVPDKLKHELMKYYQPKSSMATKEKVSDIQRAYIRLFIAKGKDSDLSPNDAAKILFEDGIVDRIWSASYCPEGVNDFVSYLSQRIKNEKANAKRKVDRLKKMADEQQERLSKKMKN